MHMSVVTLFKILVAILVFIIVDPFNIDGY